jgi:tRNA-dihydrouridine synthase B
LDIALTHFDEALAFYGERLGLKIFRKHLGWYVEAGPFPADAAERRRIKAALCRLEQPREVRAGLKALWADQERLAA